MIELNLTQLIAVLVAAIGTGGGGIWAVGRFRNGNSTTLSNVLTHIIALEAAITDLSKAVTELRIEVAKRD